MGHQKGVVDMAGVRETSVTDIIECIADIIEEVKQEMCDYYCKYPARFSEEEEDTLFEICDKCPMERL